ncbi:hypothetical protein, partial [Ruegeria arenilitoris]|uniref:hypothetical protein n=1 Tax=Ruegeria arenilitoris TaxID=1173585 RepID=UPI001480461D
GSVELTRDGVKAGPDSFPGWEAIHAEAYNGGFKVLWKNANGDYGEWITDASGAYISSTTIPDVIDVEAFYGYDINGSGTVGYELPKLAQQSSPAQKLAPEGEISGEAGWAGTVDVLEFVPNVTAEIVDEFLSVVFGAGETKIAGISIPTNLVDASSNSDLANETDAVTDLMIANLLEEDSFLL